MDMTDAKKQIEDLCAEAAHVADPAEIKPLIEELREVLHEKVNTRERWMELCERAAVEQDPRKLLELVTEINRLFEARENLPPAKSRIFRVNNNVGGNNNDPDRDGH